MAGKSTFFKVEVEPAEKGAVILHVHGDVDAHTTKLLQAKIGELFKQNQRKVILDLSHCEYMSSAGASLFIVARNESVEKGGNLVLMDVKPAVQQVLDLLGLTPMFQIVADRKSALAQF